MTSSNISRIDPKRGEIWQVDLDPTKGSEIKKIRPVLVLSSDTLRSLPLRVVVPITGWNLSFENKYSHVHLIPTKTNGLAKESAADTLQIRAVAIERFSRKLGALSASQIEEIAAAVAAVIEYQ